MDKMFFSHHLLLKNYMLERIMNELNSNKNITIEKYIENYNITSFTNCKTIMEIAEDMAEEFLFFNGPSKGYIPMKGDKEDELSFG